MTWTILAGSAMLSVAALALALLSLISGGIRGVRRRLAELEEDFDSLTQRVSKRQKKEAAGVAGERRTNLAEAKEITQAALLANATRLAAGGAGGSGSARGMPGEHDGQADLEAAIARTRGH